MPFLHGVGPDGAVFEYQLSKNRITIGRSKDCDITLADSTVSRNHAAITKTPEGYVLTDLGSFNGTKVNGVAIQTRLLRHEDQISIGKSRLTFLTEHSDISFRTASVILDADADAQQKVVGISPQSIAADSQQLLIARDTRKSRTGISSLGMAAAENHGEREPCGDVSSLERSNKVLFVLYEISRQLNSIQDFKELLTKIMDLIFMVIDADYGFLILTGGEKGEELIPMVVKYKDDKVVGTGQITASRTIINRVIRDKVALLTSNAMDDSRLDYAKSVFLQQIRSAICVPLWKKDSIIGVIQLDSIRFDNQFNHDDLELLKAIGSQMAMIIEQASLNEKIREEERLRNRLERFHSPQVVDMILRGGQEDLMEPKELTATVVFTDIVGFTSISEKLPPREVNMILNQYFSRMTDIIFRYDGTLDKYIGDGLLAVFGAPVEKEDDAIRALHAALAMRQAVEELRLDLPVGDRLDIRIGINTGKVVAGNMGSPKRLDYTVIGDPVNTAARLESIAAPHQILIGEETYRLVKDLFCITCVGSRRVKGKSVEITVYEVLSAKDGYSKPRKE
ncbi:MAG: FHA domain-containing protein [Desulfobacterota bacterium]|nr:FHA domain-containing protein [Thermodesulfobacteriota bacterium]